MILECTFDVSFEIDQDEVDNKVDDSSITKVSMVERKGFVSHRMANQSPGEACIYW